MFLSADAARGRRRGRRTTACVLGLAALVLSLPMTAHGAPHVASALVVEITTPVVELFAGTAELDGSTTLEKTTSGTRSRIDCTVLFAKDSDRLRPGAQEKLDRLARQLRAQGPGKVHITGYTDDLGSAAHGLDLSRRRAARVADALRNLLPAKTYPMEVRGRGEANPVVPNTSEANRRQNRRVVLTLTQIANTPPATTPPANKPSQTPTPQPAPTPRPATPSPTPSSAAATAAAPAPSTGAGPPPPSAPVEPTSAGPGAWPLIVGVGVALMSGGAAVDAIRRRQRRAAPAAATAGETRNFDEATAPGDTQPPAPGGELDGSTALEHTRTGTRSRIDCTILFAKDTVTTPRHTASEAQLPSTTQPTPAPTATAAVPTAEASAPDTEPSREPTPAQPSMAPTPAPMPPLTNTQSSSWPLTAGTGLVLVLLGALVDQIRRRGGTAINAPTSDRNPPPEPLNPGDAGPAATTEDAQNQDAVAAAPALPTAGPGTAPTPSTTPEPPHPPNPSHSVGPAALTVLPPPRPQKSRATDLDEDLTAWFSANTRRPRLTLLGPVQARTHGQALARRKPYYTELLAYLILKTHGATVDEIADTFTLTTARVRTDMKVLRDWLGINPTTSQPYLPDARLSPAALQRGLPTYQVQDVLCDYQLFTELQTQLHTRAATAEPEARISDLETALRLVTGRPFSHTRTNGWDWIFEGRRLDLQVTTAIVAIAETAAQHHQHRGNRTAQLHALAVAAVIDSN